MARHTNGKQRGKKVQKLTLIQILHMINEERENIQQFGMYGWADIWEKLALHNTSEIEFGSYFS